MLDFSIFSIFSGLLLFSSIHVVFASQSIHSILWLMLSFISAAALWILLNAEFLGLLLILVYVGAVLTLFLFVIMTLPPSPTPTLSAWHNKKTLTVAFSIASTGLGCLLYSIYHQKTLSALPKIAFLKVEPLKLANTQALGLQLYTHFIYPFELTGILLLTAVIVSISLHSDSHDLNAKNRVQDSSKDPTQVRREDRIKLVQGD